MDCKVEKRLLPLKAHYLLYHCAHGAILPFLPVYARQLGFTAVSVGMIGTARSIAALICRPTAGYLADRWFGRKRFLLALLAVLAAAYAGIHFVRTENDVAEFERVCASPAANGTDWLNYCQTLEPFNECLLPQLRAQIKHTEMECTLHCPAEGFPVAAYPVTIDLTNVLPVAGSEHCLQFPVVPSPKSVCSESKHNEPDRSSLCRAHCTDNANIMHLLSAQQVATRIRLEAGGGGALSALAWLFVCCMVACTATSAAVMCLTHSWCYALLDRRPHLFGLQRLWASVGWGTVSLLAGLLVDGMSRGQVLKDYSAVFYMQVGFMLLDWSMVAILQQPPKEPRLRSSASDDAAAPPRSLGRLLFLPRILVFILWLISVGFCISVLQYFLFWHLEELGESAAAAATVSQTCDTIAGESAASKHSKTLQGLVTVVQTFGGEIPMFFVAGALVRRLGHVPMMSLVLAAFGVRFLLYAWLRDPWLALPIEVLQGCTHGLAITVMTAYADAVAPPGRRTTVQGLAGATYEGVGHSLGSLLAGWAMQRVGGSQMFEWMGYAALAASAAHVAVHLVLDRCCPQQRPAEEKEASRGENGDGAAAAEVTDDMLCAEQQRIVSKK